MPLARSTNCSLEEADPELLDEDEVSMAAIVGVIKLKLQNFLLFSFTLLFVLESFRQLFFRNCQLTKFSEM